MTKQRSAPNRRNRSDEKTPDSIEEIFHQWRAERPDIDPEPVLIYGPISRIQASVTAQIDRKLAPYKLVRGTFDVLTALRRAGEPYCLSPKDLARHLVLSGAGLNGRLNILEKLGYIARLPEPNDRRTLRIQLTAKGRSLVNKLTPLLFELQWSIIAGFSPAERRKFAEFLQRMAQASRG
jgi:DNA-binding MarR family transcriptional regulator